MLPPLVLDSLTVNVRDKIGALSEAVLTQYAAVIIVTTASQAAGAFSALPAGALLRALHEQRAHHAGDVVSARIGASAQCLIVLAYVGPQSSTFEKLTLAQKCAREALAAAPQQVLLHALLDDAVLHQSAISAMIAALQAGAFRLASFKSTPKKITALQRIDVAGSAGVADLRMTLATAAGNNLARWLTALPPSELDAGAYRRFLQRFAQECGFTFKFYGEAQLKRLGAGAFLAVAQGNHARDAGIAHLSYRPRGKQAKLALVGKGICFDTGGTNLKTHKGMLDMHIDMAGSAVALGSLYALKHSGAKLAVDCWLAITENRIGPTAYKPQDIVRALNGTTIQVIHTDAEGRMVLADALAMAAQHKPGAIIDYATLTGSCVTALTERYSGAFTNRLQTRDCIEAAGDSSGERVWCFPMDADFETELESSVADIMQCAVDGKGDHILAAAFLRRFVPDNIAWLHMDLSAAMHRGGLAHIGTEITGFGVRFTLELLRRGWPTVRLA